jgi:hypothetical protein
MDSPTRVAVPLAVPGPTILIVALVGRGLAPNVHNGISS